MQINIVHDNPHFEKRIRYVFDFIENHPAANGKVSFCFDESEAADIKLGYFSDSGLAVSCDCFLPAQRTFFSRSYEDLKDVEKNSNLLANRYQFQAFDLFSVEAQPRSLQPFFVGRAFGFDVLETIFFHISRLEEHLCSDTQKDIHGRMLANEQFLVKNGIEKKPVVDHLVFCFVASLGVTSAPTPTRWRFTFDVDLMHKFSRFPPFRSTLKYVFTQPKPLVELWSQYFLTKTGKAQDPYFIFDWMLQPVAGVEQVVYFLAGGKTKFDKPFPVLDSVFAQVVKLVKAKGLGIGIHPSYASWDSLNTMTAEKAALENMAGERITRSRQHFLHFSFETTPPILEKLSIEEDSTLGYADRIGFRCGTGFAYRLYNFKEERPWHFWEVPMVVMDVGLFREANNNGAQARAIWDGFLTENAHLTQITFNFHNSRFFDAALDGIDLQGLFEEVRNQVP